MIDNAPPDQESELATAVEQLFDAIEEIRRVQKRRDSGVDDVDYLLTEINEGRMDIADVTEHGRDDHQLYMSLKHLDHARDTIIERVPPELIEDN